MLAHSKKFESSKAVMETLQSAANKNLKEDVVKELIEKLTPDKLMELSRVVGMSGNGDYKVAKMAELLFTPQHKALNDDIEALKECKTVILVVTQHILLKRYASKSGTRSFETLQKMVSKIMENRMSGASSSTDAIDDVACLF